MSSSLQERLAQVTDEIARAAGERADAVSLVVVTKSAEPTIFEQLAGLGVTDVGENRVRGAAARLTGHERSFRWHFVGHLQSNKAREAVPLFDVFHGVDSASLLRRLDRLASEFGRQLELLLQVNISGEPSKQGLTPAELPGVLETAAELTHAKVIGLMTMAPRVDDPEHTRPVFAQLAKLRDAHRSDHPDLQQLSMGMTDDFSVALQEGATIVRLGRKIVNDEELLRPPGRDQPG